MVTSDFSMGEKTIVGKANRHAIFKSNQGNRQQFPLPESEVRVDAPLGVLVGILRPSCRVLKATNNPTPGKSSRWMLSDVLVASHSGYNSQ